MDGRSNVNSFLRRKDNDQSHWRVDKEPKSPMDGQSKAKSSPQRKNNEQSHLQVDGPK